MMESKIELRKRYKLVRQNITDRDNKNLIIYNKVINNKRVINSKLVLIYFSNNYEVDTINLIKCFINSKKLVAIPKVIGREIKFYYIDSVNEVARGKFGIMEPFGKREVLDYRDSICIVPGICFDKDNYRVGYGKGYYDRFLNSYYGYTIGLTYRECLVKKISADKYDVKVDKVIFN